MKPRSQRFAAGLEQALLLPFLIVYGAHWETKPSTGNHKARPEKAAGEYDKYTA
jgi:hypothetical protein